MTLTDFVEDLEAQGVELWVHGDRLRYRGRPDLLTPEVIAQLKERKQEIMALQRERAQHSRLFPLSHGQSALWFLSKLAPTSFAYHVGFAAEIYSQVNVPALQRALQYMSERHAGLRTTFRDRNGIPVQEIHSSLLPAFEAIHLGPADAATLRTKVIEAYKCPFDLERGPLLRVRLFTCTPEHHLLLLTVHHLVCDAWSLWLLLKELGDAYQAESDGAAAALPPLGADYTDFVRWQRELIADEEGERLWAYWKNQLVGELPVLNLATDRPRPPDQTFNGGSVNFRLGPPVTARVRAFAAAEGTTPYMTLLATFAVLLHRYSGQEEVLLGSPTSGRTERQFADILGDFINTVVVRSSVAGDPSFRAYLDRFSKVALEAIAHERFPFSLLVERLRVGRDPSRSPLFQVLFNFLKPQKFQDVIELWVSGETGDPVKWGGLSMRPFALPQQEGQVDLALEMIEGKTSLLGILKYNVDLFDRATIERMAGHFETLLEHIVVDPDQPLSRVPLLKEAERHELLIEWNDTHADFPRDQCVHQLFEAQAVRTPHSTAVVFENRSLTYSQLNAQADALATGLRLLGVGPDVLVGLCTERSLGMMVGLLGILKAGGAYVPLDPDNPHSRLDFMLRDAGVSLLVTQETVVSKMQFKGQPVRGAVSVADLVVLRMTDAQTLESTQRAASTADAVTPHNLAYVIYTSGTTGKPKGAMNTHRGVVNRLLWMQDQYLLTEADTVLQKTPFSFDVSVWEFFWPLLAGARLLVAKPGGHRDAAYLVDLIEKDQVTVLHFVPPMLRVFLEQPGVKRCLSLRHVICSGEALPYDLQEQFFKLLPAQLHNLYGPTEAAVDVTHWTCQRNGAQKIVPIGRPVANTQIYILDQHLQPVPVGVPGELYIGGVQVGRGYHNRPELTAEKFISDPFGKDPEARLYKTGDVCRWLHDGNVEYLGRIDHQVKIRGFRVELGEIETALSHHEAVGQCVVVVREDTPGDKRLVAYVVPDCKQAGAIERLFGMEREGRLDGCGQYELPNGDLVLQKNRGETEFCPDRLISDMRAFLRRELPEYMIPAAFVLLETVPLSTNGKIDRRALPAPTYEAESRGTVLEPPRNETEERLAGIWSQVLGVEKVGLRDNFFDLGGDSLRLMTVHSRLRQAFNKDISMVDLFKFTTVRALAQYLAGDPDSNVSDSLQAQGETRRNAIRRRRQFRQRLSDE